MSGRRAALMECYHCATIHSELVDVLPELADGYAAQCYVGHGAEFVSVSYRTM